EGAGVLQSTHRFVNSLLRFCALLASDEHALLALRLFDLVIQRAQSQLELVNGSLLLLPLLAVLGDHAVVLFLARQRLAGQGVVASTNGQHGFLFPLRRLLRRTVHLTRQALFISDGSSHLLFCRRQLFTHVDDELVQHLLGIFRRADERIDVRLDESSEASKQSHWKHSFSNVVVGEAKAGPSTARALERNRRKRTTAEEMTDAQGAAVIVPRSKGTCSARARSKSDRTASSSLGSRLTSSSADK